MNLNFEHCHSTIRRLEPVPYEAVMLADDASVEIFFQGGHNGLVCPPGPKIAFSAAIWWQQRSRCQAKFSVSLLDPLIDVFMHGILRLCTSFYCAHPGEIYSIRALCFMASLGLFVFLSCRQ